MTKQQEKTEATNKLTKTEFDNLYDIQNRFNQIQNELGSIEVQRYDLNQQKEQLEDNLHDIRLEDRELRKKLESKYGKISVDLNSGEYTSVD